MSTGTKTKQTPEQKAASKAARRDAETRKILAEAAEAEYRAEQERVSAATIKLDFDQRMASDYHDGIFHFNQSVGANSCQQMQAALAQHHRRFPKSDIEIVFNSPGGSVFEGMALFDYITHLRHEGHHVTTTCRGMAASMAGILLQAGDTRRIGAESYVLIHEISTLAAGKLGELIDEVEFMKRISKRVVDIFVERSGGKLSAAKIKANWRKTDWWLDSRECLELGVVDEVV